MKKITQVTTVDQLYKSQDQETGNIIVDALVYYLRHSKSHKAADAALFLDVEQRWLNDSVRIFVGTTLQRLIQEWRLRTALDLLDNQELSLLEVAQRCGYRQDRQFSDAFMNRFGVTPLAYRTGSQPNNGRYDSNQSAQAQREFQAKIEALRRRDNIAPDSSAS